MSDAVRSFGSAALVVVLATLVGRFAGLTLRVVLARGLPPEQFGSLGSALAILTLAAGVGSFGVPRFLISHHANDQSSSPGDRLVFLSAVSLGAAVAGLFAAAWMVVMAGSPLTAQVAVIMLPVVLLLGVSDLWAAYGQISGRFRQVALTQALPWLALLAAAIVAILLGFQALGVAAAIAMASAVAVAGVGTAVVRRREEPVGKSSAIDVVRVLSSSWPYAITAVAYLLYYQVDQIMIEAIAGPAEAAQYIVAVTYTGAAFFVVGTIGNHVVQYRLLLHGTSGHEVVTRLTIQGAVMFAAGSLAAAVLAVSGNLMIPLVFGDEYSASVQMSMVLAASIPLVFAVFPAMLVLTAVEHIKVKAGLVATVAGFNIALNLILIPSLGGIGAALATVLSYALLTIGVAVVLRRRVLVGSRE